MCQKPGPLFWSAIVLALKCKNNKQLTFWAQTKHQAKDITSKLLRELQDDEMPKKKSGKRPQSLLLAVVDLSG